MGRSLLFSQPVKETIVKNVDDKPELPLDFQELESLTNQPLLQEQYVRDSINRECDYVDRDIEIALEAFDSVLTAVEHITTLKDKEDLDTNEITFALEAFDRSVNRLSILTNGHIDAVEVGLENIIKSPLMSIEAACENVGNVIRKVLQQIMSFLTWLYDKFVGWLRYLGGAFSMLKKTSTELKRNLEEFLKYHPDVNILRGDSLRHFASWFNGSYRGVIALQDRLLITPSRTGISNLGDNMQSLIFKEQNLVYPTSYEISFQSLNEFYISFRNYYSKIDINSDRELTNMTNDLATYLLERHGLGNHDTTDTVVRLISCDFRSLYYFICATGENGNKVVIDRVSYRQISKSYSRLLDKIEEVDINAVFGNSPVRWIYGTCDILIRNSDRALSELNKVAGRVKRARDDVKRVYNQYALGNSNTEVAKIATRYGRYVQRIVTKYQQGSVNANIQVFRDLKIIANRLYSHLIQSS